MFLVPQHYQNAHGIQSSNSADLGQAARKIVSSVYNLGKVGWDTLGPLVYKAYGGKEEAAAHGSSSSMEEKITPMLGGAVAVLDFFSVASHSPSKNSSSGAVEIGLQVVCKFIAHEEGLEVMTFSPSGLLLASASQSGQVVHIHSLCTAGLLFSSAAKGIVLHNRRPRYEQTPQLVHKLVRGLTLSRVLNICFDNLESCVAISTTNGTVHLFELDRQNISSYSHSAPLGSAGSSKPPSIDHSSSPLDYHGISSSDDHAPGTSAGSSWASSAPLSNIDDLISQLASQQAVDGIPSDSRSRSRSRDSNGFHFKQSYSSQRIRLPIHSHPVSSISDLDGAPNEATKAATANSGIDAISKWANSSNTFNSGFSSISSVLVNVGSKSKGYKQDSEYLALYAISSQGFLSRFRLSPPVSVVSSSNGNRPGIGYSTTATNGLAINNGNGHLVPIELNRWDLIAAPVEDSPNSLSSSPNDAGSYLLSPPIRSGGGTHGNHKTDITALRGSSSAYITKKNPINGTYSSATSWLPLFGETHTGSSNVEAPLWTRPQVSFRIRIKQSATSQQTEKEKHTSRNIGNSKESQGSISNYSFLFPERTSTIAIGPIRPQHVLKSIYHSSDPDLDINIASVRGASSNNSITSLISSAIKTELMSNGVAPDQKSGRHVASKHGAKASASTESSRAALEDGDEDWQIPSDVEWEDSK